MYPLESRVVLGSFAHDASVNTFNTGDLYTSGHRSLKRIVASIYLRTCFTNARGGLVGITSNKLNVESNIRLSRNHQVVDRTNHLLRQLHASLLRPFYAGEPKYVHIQWRFLSTQSLYPNSCDALVGATQ